MESNKSLENVINLIKVATGLTQEEIADRIKYKREYLSQAKKTNSAKLIQVLENTFKEELGEYSGMLNLVAAPTKKKVASKKQESDLQLQLLKKLTETINRIDSNLIETRHGVEMNQALSKANLFQSAKLELIGTKPGQWTDDDHQNIVRDLNEVTAKIFLETQIQSNRTNVRMKAR